MFSATLKTCLSCPACPENPAVNRVLKCTVVEYFVGGQYNFTCTVRHLILYVFAYKKTCSMHHTAHNKILILRRTV